MVVIALLAIFASIAVPSFTTLIANTRTETAASELHSLLTSARSDAVTKRVSITLNNKGTSWESAQGSNVTSTITLPAGVSLNTTPAGLTSLVFRSDGSASQPATLALSNDRGNKAYAITVQAAGLIRLSSSSN